jgi:SAM-dependent methyltransferase
VNAIVSQPRVTDAPDRILHVGCGPAKLPGSVGIDVNPASSADVIHDLERFPYPFADGAFDEIICHHVIEHLDNIPGVLQELHRICAPGGRIEIRGPHFSSVHYYRDPTHRHPFSLRTFDYFVEGTSLNQFQYTSAKFRLTRAEFLVPNGAGPLKRLVFRALNRYGDLYEKRFAFWLPRHELLFELRPVK